MLYEGETLAGGIDINLTEESSIEQGWVEAAGSDPQAFAYLYSSYFPRVYGYVYYKLGSVQDAEDAVAEIFFNAMEALGRGQFKSNSEGNEANSFAVWLFRIAHNAVASYYRRTGKQPERVPLGEIEDIEAQTPTPEAAILLEEEFARLREMLLTLTPRRQEIITLRFYGGLRNYEIAHVLGLDERTVSSQICRAIDDLQRGYNREELGHGMEKSF